MYSLASCQVDGSASPYVRWRSRHPTKHGAWHNALISGLVEDDISSRLRDTHLRGLAQRRRPILEELTSRKSGSDIPNILDRLELTFNKRDDEKRQAQRKAGKKLDPVPPYDVILATNMISVGVDVGRLGLMVVAGQPKTTAEYIQATSRVGRQFPGLVITVYNWARPRDLSHYEMFGHYHATFYKQVEALSVTPFAPRALDRGLSGVMVSLMRLLEANELNPNLGAGQLNQGHSLSQKAMEAIKHRVEMVTQDKNHGTRVQAMMAERHDVWLKEIENAETYHLGYRGKRDGTTKGLLQPAGIGSWERFTCLHSLRDVEPNCNLILVEGIGMQSRPGVPPADEPETKAEGKET